jgi:hypothetical protein
LSATKNSLNISLKKGKFFNLNLKLCGVFTSIIKMYIYVDSFYFLYPEYRTPLPNARDAICFVHDNVA